MKLLQVGHSKLKDSNWGVILIRDKMDGKKHIWTMLLIMIPI